MTTNNETGSPRTIKASEFKAKCLQLMDEVAESGEEIVITKFGKPVARLGPLRQKPKDSLRHRPRAYRNPGRYRVTTR